MCVKVLNSDIKPQLPVADPERFYRSGEKKDTQKISKFELKIITVMITSIKSPFEKGDIGGF